MQLDCIIIGGGPGGLTAATYLRRFHRRVQVFDDGRSRARWIPESHNCPGFPLGVSGTQLLRKLHDQAATYDVEVNPSRIESITPHGEGWRVVSGETAWHAPVVLLATGAQDRLPALERGDVDAAIDAGRIRLCAICDGYEATDTSIAVLGPLEGAIRHACFLRTFTADVSVVPTPESPDDTTSELDTWKQRADGLGIRVLPALASLSCDSETCHVADAAGNNHRFDTVYAAMGAPARSELAAGAGAALSGDGSILTDDKFQTSCPGLYAIGDVVTELNQISVAFGHAAIAATAIHRALPQAARGG